MGIVNVLKGRVSELMATNLHEQMLKSKVPKMGSTANQGTKKVSQKAAVSAQ